MNKYRRIEVNAFRRRVTIVSGEWPTAAGVPPLFPTEDSVSLNDADACEPVEPASPEGQQILVEAVRSLERRLSPEALAMIRSRPNTPANGGSGAKGFFLKLRYFSHFVYPQFLRLVRREK